MRALIVLGAGLGLLLFAGPNPGATATLLDAQGREVGQLSLSDIDRGIQVTGELHDLPEGEHAIHLHTVGRCEPSFDAAGGHWNPTGREHGQHLGDLPNMVVREGRVTVNATTSGGTLGGEHALLDADGAAVIVHAGPDDYRSQPAGNAGGRIACGVVTR